MNVNGYQVFFEEQITHRLLTQRNAFYLWACDWTCLSIHSIVRTQKGRLSHWLDISTLFVFVFPPFSG